MGGKILKISEIIPLSVIGTQFPVAEKRNTNKPRTPKMLRYHKGRKTLPPNGVHSYTSLPSLDRHVLDLDHESDPPGKVQATFRYERVIGYDHNLAEYLDLMKEVVDFDVGEHKQELMCFSAHCTSKSPTRGSVAHIVDQTYDYSSFPWLIQLKCSRCPTI